MIVPPDFYVIFEISKYQVIRNKLVLFKKIRLGMKALKFLTKFFAKLLRLEKLRLKLLNWINNLLLRHLYLFIMVWMRKHQLKNLWLVLVKLKLLIPLRKNSINLAQHHLKTQKIVVHISKKSKMIIIVVKTLEFRI